MPEERSILRFLANGVVPPSGQNRSFPSATAENRQVLISAVAKGAVGIVLREISAPPCRFSRSALAEKHHQRRVKGQLFVIIARIPAEILKIWVLLNLKRGFLVRIAILRLNDAGSQGQPQRLGRIAFPVGE